MPASSEPPEEVRLHLSFLAQQWTAVLDHDGVHHAFDMARDHNTPFSYGDTIVERVKAVGAILAAVEDVADAMGDLDYDEAIDAVFATVAQWNAVANALEPTDRLAFHVRVAARQLQRELDRGGYDPEMLADLISIASFESELTNTALTWLQATEDGTESDFWKAHGERAQLAMKRSAALKADLRDRGELDLDDRLVIHEPDTATDDQ